MIKQKQQGFILLIGAMVVAASLVIIGVSVAMSEIVTKREVLNNQQGEQNFTTAHQCMEEALLRLFNWYFDTTSPLTFILNGQTCTVTFTKASDTYPVYVTATNNQYTQRIEAWIEYGLNGATGWTVTSWREAK